MEQFFKVPNKVFTLPLSSNTMLVLIYLLRCSNKGESFPSYSNIAKACKLTRRTAIRCIKALDGKYITITRSTVNHYHITWLASDK